jgi:HK97 gp10 family phage protein
MIWNDDVIKDLEKELNQRIEKAAIHLMNQIKINLNESQPYTIYTGENGKYYHGDDPSKPGEYPKKVRGDLQRSITYTTDKVNHSAQVGTNLPYGEYLELGTVKMAPRSFLRRTLIEEQGKIDEIMSK